MKTDKKPVPQADPTVVVSISLKGINKLDWVYITSTAKTNGFTMAEMVAIFATALHEGQIAVELAKLRQHRDRLLGRGKGEDE